jgi:hypothetical protein
MVRVLLSNVRVSRNICGLDDHHVNTEVVFTCLNMDIFRKYIIIIIILNIFNKVDLEPQIRLLISLCSNLSAPNLVYFSNSRTVPVEKSFQSIVMQENRFLVPKWIQKIQEDQQQAIH